MRTTGFSRRDSRTIHKRSTPNGMIETKSLATKDNPNKTAASTNNDLFSSSREYQNSANATAMNNIHGISSCASWEKRKNMEEDASNAAAPSAYTCGSISSANQYITRTIPAALIAETSRAENDENPSNFTASAIPQITSGGCPPKNAFNGVSGKRLPEATMLSARFAYSTSSL